MSTLKMYMFSWIAVADAITVSIKRFQYVDLKIRAKAFPGEELAKIGVSWEQNTAKRIFPQK